MVFGLYKRKATALGTPNNKNRRKIRRQTTQAGVINMTAAIRIVRYSEKSVAVFGDTKAIKEQLKTLGGRFNRGLMDPASGMKAPGWIFSWKKEKILETELGLKKTTSTTRPPVGPVSPPPPVEPVSPPPTPPTTTTPPPPTPPRETSDDISVLPRELQGKYHDYVAKKKKVQETGRQSNSRDASRSKVYSAEHVFQQSNPSVKKIMTESDAVTFFNNVVSSPVYKTLSKNNKPKLYIENTMTSKLLKGAQIAGCANQAYVKLARKSGGLNKYVILHELSHTCGNAHHDIKFREDQIKLVSAFMSKSLGTKLRRCYAASKLKTAVPDKIMGPTEWLASYEKITNARKK